MGRALLLLRGKFKLRCTGRPDRQDCCWDSAGPWLLSAFHKAGFVGPEPRQRFCFNRRFVDCVVQATLRSHAPGLAGALEVHIEWEMAHVPVYSNVRHLLSWVTNS